jgi:hypothetical protein
MTIQFPGMRSAHGAILGAIGGPVVTGVVIFIWCGIQGASPCGRADFVPGGLFGLFVFMPLLVVPASLVGGAVGATIPAIWARVRMKPEGRCVQCGYDLRGIDSKVCPECGTIR